MRKGLKSWVFVGSVLAAATTLAIGYEVIEGSAQLPVYGPKELSGTEELDHHIPDFELIAQDGGTFSSGIMRDKIVVANFFFTSCPSICPQMMRNMQSVHELYRNDPRVLFISMTVDPKRDDPARLQLYADGLNANTDHWRFLTGEKKDIYGLARHGFFVSAVDGDGGNLDFIHSENLVLVDRTGRIRGYYNGLDESAMEDLSKDITKLKKERT